MDVSRDGSRDGKRGGKRDVERVMPKAMRMLEKGNLSNHRAPSLTIFRELCHSHTFALTKESYNANERFRSLSHRHLCGRP